MSHRLGSLITLGSPLVIGPDSGASPTATNTWTVTFSPADPGGVTKFQILHFTGASLPGSNRLEVDLGYATDIFTSASGADFWSRPIAGNSVTIRYIDDGVGPPSGKVDLGEYGRGEGLAGGGATNTNADLFLLSSPYVEPTFFNSAGVCPGGANPSWENVAVLPAGVMRDCAQRVGMILHAHDGHLSSCSGTLMTTDPATGTADLVLTAGHCITGAADVASASFTFDFQTNADGTRPAGYNPRFFKVRRVVRAGLPRPPTDTRPSRDYCILQIDTPSGGFPFTPLALRSSAPAISEQLFVIHHPRGVTKKVSRRPADPQCSVNPEPTNPPRAGVLYYSCDSDNGSSGSSVLDMQGRIVAVNDWAFSSCLNAGERATDILADIATAPAPPTDVDVVVVLDRSGSMSLPGMSGATKMREAQQATALFIDLLRTDRTHRVALVSFSTSPGVNSGLTQVTAAHKDVLIGPDPHDSGVVGALSAGGMTTIGGGLRVGKMQLSASSANTPAMLLMTDGLQNTPPMIAEVETELGGTRLSIVGFGTEASLDGPLLTRLARDHGGIYGRAGDGLKLKKFFVLSFGNIFHTASSMDPEYVLEADASAAEPIPFSVCGEIQITVVLGWEHSREDLTLRLETPAGTTITPSSPGVVSSSGDTWVHMRLQLPFNAERDGEWQIIVARPSIPTVSIRADVDVSEPVERFFVTVVVDGGPQLRPIDGFRYYTGDALIPQVELRYPTGELVHDATVILEIEAPDNGTGNVLVESGLRSATEPDGDTLDPRASTLIALENEKGSELITRTTQSFELFDDGDHFDGGMEPDGVFADVLTGMTRHEGNYTFRARASYGDVCQGTREVSWSIYVGIAIDPDATTVTAETVGTLPDGRDQVRVTFTPRDRFGNHLGPGRLESFEIAPLAGDELIGSVTDQGDGTYTQDVARDPGAVTEPGVSVTQPERPPVALTPSKGKVGCPPWLWWLLVLGWALLVILLIVWLLS
jgi:hypothetical protein